MEERKSPEKNPGSFMQVSRQVAPSSAKLRVKKKEELRIDRRNEKENQINGFQTGKLEESLT